ncbi:MAG: DEAD/DEAH box helicase [Snowella sp.]|nr:DEAD/DEAH box helicase [Snowella sp.]
MKDSDLANLTLKDLFPFKLDDFQKEAIAVLDAGKSVVVCAPTGSGKTVIGEYAIIRALMRGKRVFYTTPLKALSNQKVRDFQDKLRAIGVERAEFAVGLITGDVVVNPNAPIVVMTTEIFRNMLYETPIGQVGTSLENVETVVFDECHYISDRGRGTVWEESIIYCPSTIQLVALSATIGKPEQLTDWINQVRLGSSLKSNRRRSPEESLSQCELVNSNFRPVPLHFHFSSKSGLYPLFNNKNKGINPHLLPPKSQRDKKPRRLRREDCPSVLTIVQQLQEEDFLPAIYVIFSRRGCEQAVRELRNLTLVTPEEAQTIQLNLLLFFLISNPALQEQLLASFGSDHPDFASRVLAFVDNPQEFAEPLIQTFTQQPETLWKLWQWFADSSPMTHLDQIEPLLRGIAVHHAGILPAWKELVEKLFESGLIKVVFATATLSAGINMPARTTVISALSKRTDDGHSMLSPSEFLQIAGRAGRRGMDTVGHVVTVQSPFEGAKEAAYLATAEAEPLRSWFTPTYGMVLNLLQKHTVEEAKDLLERSFAEYLAQLELEPTQAAIARLLSQIAQLDIKLAGINEKDIRSFEKFRARLREEERLLKILQQQAEKSHRQEIAARIVDLPLGQILHLKGKHIKIATPLLATVVKKTQGFSQLPELICLGADNRWYHVTSKDVFEINSAALPENLLTHLTLPPLEFLTPGRPFKGDEATLSLAQQIAALALPLLPAPEVVEQQQRVEHVQKILETHPLQQQKHPHRIIESFHQRAMLREELEKRQIEFKRLQSRQSYYWQEFLDLIAILQELEALDEFAPTPLGEAAATVRGENELWLGLVFMSGKFSHLAPHHLAAAASGLITETLRPDTWTSYAAPPEVLAALRPHVDLTLMTLVLRSRMTLTQPLATILFLIYYLGRTNLWELRRKLIQTQKRYGITIPLWLEVDLLGLVEQWALGATWDELCTHTSLDEGDLVRILRRTIDLLWQIPQIPNVSDSLKTNARKAVSLMKRFPV